jgi:hypothetical protein
VHRQNIRSTDLRQAEELYVNDPKRMEKFMEGMNIKSLCLNAKKKKLTDLAHQLVADQIIAIPTQVFTLLFFHCRCHDWIY